MPWGETGLDCFIQSACLYIVVMEFLSVSLAASYNVTPAGGEKFLCFSESLNHHLKPLIVSGMNESLNH